MRIFAGFAMCMYASPKVGGFQAGQGNVNYYLALCARCAITHLQRRGWVVSGLMAVDAPPSRPFVLEGHGLCHPPMCSMVCVQHGLWLTGAMGGGRADLGSPRNIRQLPHVVNSRQHLALVWFTPQWQQG